MQINAVSGSTKVLGVFGYPIQHSLSPQMQNAALRYMGLDYCYVPFAVIPDDLRSAVQAIRALGITGVNVTIPHKVAVVQYIDVLSYEAKLIGAVNTIHNRQGLLYGHNTDGQGFIQSLMRDANVDPADKTIVILGAGGAARGIGIPLALKKPKQVVVAARNKERAVELARDMASVEGGCSCIAIGLDCSELKVIMESADILVDTTPVGMYPHSSEPPVVGESFMHEGMLVCDLVYNPMYTSLLQAAKRAGASILSGVGMLAYQGALSLELWTEREPPFELMKEVLIKSLEV
jgi:shikimate dehydrogenase